ncbi:MAG: hypothetical protein ACREJ0_02320 [Geminicoccaceae bacterium]
MRCLLCLSILLALPCAASADQLSAAGSIRPESTPAIEGAEASADPAPVLDLSFDPPLPAEQRPPAVAPHAEPAPPGRDAAAPFSVGVKIKTRREVGSPASRASSDPEDRQTLTDEVEGIVERSTVGVTGTYRF